MANAEQQIRVIQQQKTLANGTVKTYTVHRKVIIKGGYMRSDGTRRPSPVLGEEIIAEIKQKHSMGVTIKRLCADYDLGFVAMKKILE